MFSFVVYNYVSFIKIYISKINEAAALSEGNAKGGKKLDTL